MAKPKGKQISINRTEEKDPSLSDLKEFLKDHYDIQFNGIAEKPEIKERYSNNDFEILEDYSFNSMFFRAKSKGLKVTVDTLRRLLESDFVDKVNPLRDYILSLDKISGTNFIEQIIDSVEFDNTETKEFFKGAFIKWFVALVANIFDETRCTNHTCLVFTGEQGKRKTTWFNSLIPKPLSQYKYNGKIDPNNKDTKELVHSKLLIIIDDQLKQINKKDENEIKELITTDFVTYRRSYGYFNITRPHLATFAATVNGDDFLTDATGSRRFLSFRIENCNIEKLQKVDLNKAYSEAYQLYKNGFRYWFDDNEIQKIDEKNQEFTITTIEQELIEQLYDTTNPNREFYSAGEIKLYIEGYTKDWISPKKIGEAMTKLGLKKQSIYTDDKKVKKKYGVSKKSISDYT